MLSDHNSVYILILVLLRGVFGVWMWLGAKRANEARRDPETLEASQDMTETTQSSIIRRAVLLTMQIKFSIRTVREKGTGNIDFGSRRSKSSALPLLKVEISGSTTLYIRDVTDEYARQVGSGEMLHDVGLIHAHS